MFHSHFGDSHLTVSARGGVSAMSLTEIESDYIKTTSGWLTRAGSHCCSSEMPDCGRVRVAFRCDRQRSLHQRSGPRGAKVDQDSARGTRPE